MENYEQYIGQIFDERYRVDALLGEGGMSAVLFAKDLKEKRNVAIKLLKEEYTEDKQAVKRFVNESKAVAMLNHPNIVKVYDVVMTKEQKYLVMEYIEGETLREYMDRVGAIPFDKVVSFLSQILGALDHAHSKGVIHRDIKPQNIIVLKNGKIVVTDFGIAQIVGGENISEDKAIGTVYYISPEQASGEPIDARSDIYSLGAMLFEMLTGKLPFDAESTVSIAMMQINSKPPYPRDILPTIPVGMEQIVLYALEKSPDDRFQSAKQMLKYLDALIADPFAEFAISPRDQQKRELEEEKRKENEKSEDGEPKPKEKNVVHVRGDSWSPMPVVLGVLTAFFIVLMVAGYYAVVNIFWDSNLNVFTDKSGENVTIPDYVGKPFTDADKAYLLEDLHYKKVTILEEYNSIVEKGKVISQDPIAGEVRKLNVVELTVVVSKGSNVIEERFPDYGMQDYRIVNLTLRELGYTVEMIPVQSDSVDACLVISTVPVAGEKVSGTVKTVKVYYSEGPKAEKLVCDFPDFVGMTEQNAKYYIDLYGLNLVGISYEYSEHYDTGVIISSTVSKGPKPKLTPFSLVISLGKDPDSETTTVIDPAV